MKKNLCFINMSVPGKLYGRILIEQVIENSGGAKGKMEKLGVGLGKEGVERIRSIILLHSPAPLVVGWVGGGHGKMREHSIYVRRYY